MRAGAREEIVIDRKVPECPLCGAAGPTPLGAWDAREYWSCPRCQLAFVPERYWPTPEAELARYNLHRNGPEDAGYIAFLERLARPLAERLPPGARGLDYGCGPVPVLGRLLQARGFAALPFDPFYFPKFLEGPFDFIASSETFEHFRRPGEEMVRLRGLLHPGGLLGIMTAFWDEETFVRNWHYRRDFTHLCFYRKESMEWIGRSYGFEIIWCDGERVTILQRT